VAVCPERNQGPLVYALRQDACLVLFPVNPLTLAKYREAFTPSHAKDDPTDAELQLALLRTHRDTLKPLQPQRPAMRALEPLVAHRRRLVGDTVRLTNRLTSALTHDFPHVLHWVHDKDPTVFCAFLTPWPTLNAAQLARRSTLERCFRAHHGRDAAVIDQRLQASKSATPRTSDAGVIAPTALLVRALVSQLRVTWQAIDAFDHAMAQHAQSHPDVPWVDALPGAGAVWAPRLLAAFGEPRDRDTSADELSTYAGMAPVTERRGNPSWVHWRLQCPTFRRQTVVEWAAEAIRHACWARAYDQQQRNTGPSHQAAVRALACTWSRMRFRCWRNRTPSDASVSLNAWQRRGSPLVHNWARGA
jgi:transposase